MSDAFGRPKPISGPPAHMIRIGFLVLFVAPYVLLFGLSLGSGWSYPNLVPDRIDFRPWRDFFGDDSRLLRATLTTVVLSPCVATLSTMIGVMLGRQVHARRGIWIFLAYLPFACSPVIVGICVLDLFIRLGIASTVWGVFLIQSVFASAYATVLFSELWSPESRRYEQVVRTHGGNRWDTFRHGIWPRMGRLMVICWVQTGLFSWFDYGFVSVIGGGVVPSITLLTVATIREASVNQAAQAGLVLMLPTIPLMLVVGRLIGRRHRLSEVQDG